MGCMSEKDIREELFIIKNALFDLKEKVIDKVEPDFKSRYFTFLYSGITFKQSTEIDHLLVSYQFLEDIPSLKVIQKDISKIIGDSEIHENVILNLLKAYHDDSILPIVGKILEKNNLL
jgi:S-adenosylmethionine synthetase